MLNVVTEKFIKHMIQKIYQVDAFADEVFKGNPAAVCPLNAWLEDGLMQKIAMENNLAETAFYVKQQDQYEIRWFTPTVEVDLCGHATLASAFVLFELEGYEGEVVHFYSKRSGPLKVSKSHEMYTLDFPSDPVVKTALSHELTALFNIAPQEAYRGKTDFLFIFKNEDEILSLVPDLSKIAAVKARGIIVSAPGNSVDFVSRFFAPQSGVNEDPVTGSAHTTLTPFWAKRFNKNHLSAVQLSSRRGNLQCTDKGERVGISGTARLYLKGEIFI